MGQIRYSEAQNELDNRNIKSIRPLIPPQILMEEYPLSLQAAQVVMSGRRDIEAIMQHAQDRLIVIVGPCSVHDVRAGIEYGACMHTDQPSGSRRTRTPRQRISTSSCACTLRSRARLLAGRA